MSLEYNAWLMRIYLSESHRYEGKPLHAQIVAAMLAQGLHGATAFLGAGGFGSQRRVSSDMFVEVQCDLPVAIEVVEEEARLRAFLPTLESMLEDGVVTVERIFVKSYGNAPETT